MNRGIAPVCKDYSESVLKGVCDRCGFIKGHHTGGIVFQRLPDETDDDLRKRIADTLATKKD